MNEVTKIHLGRQVFTISADAHSELKSYLDEVKKRVKDKEVINEIELRMAELLLEHGVSANKVVLPGDVDFLKEQLGSPKDFTDEDKLEETKQLKTKRLFRDTDNAMIAGVAAGLAQYFGVDVLLIRILFIISVFITFGWGILLYIVLWLLVPEAKTSSDRLQMAGIPVNVDSLKEIVERADVKGVAHRASTSLSGPINSMFRVVLKLVGLAFILAGLSIIFGLITAATYFLFNHSAWQQNNIFPVGFRESLLLYIALAVTALIGMFAILLGTSIFRRKWPVSVWVTGVLIGLTFVGLAVGGALAGDVYPNIRDRYNANIHSSLRSTSPFMDLNINGNVDNINFQSSNSYYVGFSYFDHPNLANIKTSVSNKTLVIDTTKFNEHRNCSTICIPKDYNLTITVYSPNALQLENQFYPVAPVSPKLQPIY